MANNSLKDRLVQCETRQEVEKVFVDLGINDLSKRIDALNNIMGDPETFCSSGTPDENFRYQREVSIFLTGDWKINEYYERAGL